jgi:hypothetical protein
MPYTIAACGALAISILSSICCKAHCDRLIEAARIWLGLGAAVLKRLIIGDNFTPAVAAMDDVDYGSSRQASLSLLSGSADIRCRKGLRLRCLGYGCAFASWHVESQLWLRKALLSWRCVGVGTVMRSYARE